MPELKKQPIQRKKLADAVFERLIVLIRDDGYRPGEQMPAERDLMESYGVGRPVVREAMQRLATMGMITIQHGERARVEQVDVDSMIGQIDLSARHLLSTSPQNVGHLHEARMFVESGLVKLAAERASAADIERLKEALANMRRKIDSDDFTAADMQFHIEIARISGNPIYVAMVRAALQWMADFRGDMLQQKGRRTTLKEHECIVDCVIQRDPAGAERALREHLARPKSPAVPKAVKKVERKATLMATTRKPARGSPAAGTINQHG